MIEWTKSGSCRQHSDVPEGAIVTAINGRSVIGRCEGCGRYLCENSSYVSDQEGYLTCASCCPTVVGQRSVK